MSLIFILIKYKSIYMLCTESDSLELKQDNKNILTLWCFMFCDDSLSPLPFVYLLEVGGAQSELWS